MRPAGLTGGQFSIFQDASERTAVHLATPRVRLTQRRDRLRATIAVRGGDEQVSLKLRFRGRVLATTRLGPGGHVAITIKRPGRAGLITATATVDGARRASSSKRLPAP